ncbi:uncharacterized protein [Macrobrachium rosenbergii]|uniref:uncharacterized protein n=1 Tax=Macrobrachium rosenbergii TaxID=79674 RepID=UPI0034D6162E
MSQDSRYQDHHHNQQQYTNSGALLPVPADMNGAAAPFLPEISFSEIWDIRDPQSNELLVNYGHPNSSINLGCSSGDGFCESNDGAGQQKISGMDHPWISPAATQPTSFADNLSMEEVADSSRQPDLWQRTRTFLPGNESSSAFSPSCSSPSQFMETSNLSGDTPWHPYTPTNTTDFANQTYCTASTNSVSYNTVSPSAISPSLFGEGSNLIEGSHCHSHAPADNSDFRSEKHYSTSNNTSIENQPFVDTNSSSSLPGHPWNYSLEADFSQMNVGYLGRTTESNSVGQPWELPPLQDLVCSADEVKEVFDDLHLTPPLVNPTAKPAEKQRQPGQHRNRRLRLPEGEEREQHRRRLANVRARDHNVKKKKEMLMMEAREERLKKENAQLNEIAQSFEAMKTYGLAVYDQYVKPSQSNTSAP